MNDRKLFVLLIVLLALPVGLAFLGNDRFRYPCQDPQNWDKDFCKMPLCDVTRTCPEQIFKGQRDPRLGPPPVNNDGSRNAQFSNGSCPAPVVNQGVVCGK